MSHKILRLVETSKKTGKSRSGIYADINNGTFPRPIKLGKRAIGFIEADIDEWIEQQIKKSKGGEK